MLKKFLVFLFILHQVNNIDIHESIDEFFNTTLRIGLSQTYNVEYRKDSIFFFDIKDESNYQVNIHSINCNLKLDFGGKIINQINLDTYSIKMNTNNKNITIKPLIDINNGEEKENYDQKRCHLSINSIKLDQPEIKIETKEDSVFYFDSQDLNSLNISYKLKNFTSDSFASLFFQFNEKSNFSINIINNNGSNSPNVITKNIYNSTFIFLNSDNLQTVLPNEDLNLNIIIEKNDNKAVNMNFKIIEKEMISMLKKDSLNYGFMTTYSTYQYYYMEVFKREEGQIMLHNKRFYGQLIAKIVNKTEFNEEQLNDISIYPRGLANDSKYLKYYQNSLQLTYDYKDTLKCFEGCYILITYEQTKCEGYYPKIGYEFTLLSRSWNYSDYIPQIVDIPFNEYILGTFEKDSITHHYYSISIPSDAEKIIIQLEGNYIDGFYGEGRKRINTMKLDEDDQNLEIYDSQNLITLEKEKIQSKNNIISFALRPKDYFADIFSFYYFRILYLKKDEPLYFPVDSTFGNLCLPEYDSKTKFSYCRLMFENKYNELSINFSVSSHNQNEYFKIYVTKIYKNGTTEEETKELYYIYNNPYNIRNTSDDGFYNNYTNDIEYIYFTFEFQNSEIKSIISALRDSIKNYYPQIYSPQMFYIIGFNKTCFYRIKNKYTLIYKYIYGSSENNGWVHVSFLNYNRFFSNRNFRGKPFAVDVDSSTDTIYHAIKAGELLFVFKLEYIMRNKGITEIKSGETRSQILKSGVFPLYYYLKLKNKDYNNIDVNLRLNSFDDSVMVNNFRIRGYLLDEDTIKRKINGEYIQLNNPINGYYSNKFKVGLLEVNQNKTDNNNYLLIEIANIELRVINSYLLVEFVTREYHQDIYFMPINQYIIETFDDKNNLTRAENKYQIYVSQRATSQVMIELSPEYNDIDLNFTDETLNSKDFNCVVNPVTGFKKYRIYNSENDNVYFNVINPKKRKANYMIRYYYTYEEDEYGYYLHDNIIKKYIDENDEYITLFLSINPIDITLKKSRLDNSYTIYFYISGILYKNNETSKELLNTTSILQDQTPLYEDNTVNVYSYKNPENFNLTFRNIPRKDNYIYDLQIQVNVFINRYLFNEEFLIFTKKIDLTDIKKEPEKSYLWYILGPILGVIGFLLIAFFVIKYIRLSKANVNLEKEMKSMVYTNEIQRDILVKKKIKSEKESDYETTFI